MIFKLRKYQEESVEKSLKYFKKDKNIKPSVLVAPTGAGKSLIISSIAKKLKNKTLVLQPSKELLEQNYNKLISFGGTAFIYSASMGIREIGNITYATLGSIKKIGKKFKQLGVTNVLVDEVHHGYNPKPDSMFRKFIKDLNPKYVLGLSATPFRLKPYGTINDNWSQLNMLTYGRPTYFKEILHIVPISLMVEKGHWAKLKYEQFDFDESKLTFNTTGAEYTEYSIKQAVEEQGVNNNIYLRIKSLLKEGKKSILVFCDSVYTAKKMASLFKEGACVYSGMPKKERDRIIIDFKKGIIKLVTNFSVLGVGFDYPELEVIIFGRPSNSLTLIYQWGGRVVRPHKSKEYGLIIDFCNNIKRFGKLEDLNFKNVEGYGWNLFSKDRLLTNCRLDIASITLEELRDKGKSKILDKENMEIWFGKHKHKRVNQIPNNYIKFALEKWDFTHSNMKKLKIQFKNRLENDKK